MYIGYVSKIGRSRSKPRIWLEGGRLSSVGIEPGNRFTVFWDVKARAVVLSFCEDGDRIVSHRVRGEAITPIVDINTGQIADTLGSGVDRARVCVSRQEIRIEVHPDDRAVEEREARVAERLSCDRPLSIGSLSVGGGILDLALHTGLQAAGVRSRLAFANDIDRSVLAHAARRNPVFDANTRILEAPMEEVAIDDFPKVDILVGGLPCVGASKAGKAKNHNELTEGHATAGALFVTFLRTVKHTNPAVVLLENVPDFRTSASAAILRSALATWGYEIHEAVLDSADYGCIERRRRLCLVAVTRSLSFSLERVLEFQRPNDRSLADILDPVEADDPSWRDTRYLDAKQDRDAASGANFKRQIVRPGDRSIGVLGAGYSRVRSTEPHLAHPSKPGFTRLLTPMEHARAKGIPETLATTLLDGLAASRAHRMLGNSVSWPVFHAVGHVIGDALQGICKAAPPPPLRAPIQLDLLAA